MWPTLTKAEVARDLYLEIEAGSSGRPNQAQELQNFERLAPILMQLPGIKPSFLVKQALEAAGRQGRRRRGDRRRSAVRHLDERRARCRACPASGDPNAQGPQGANNAPAPPQDRRRSRRRRSRPQPSPPGPAADDTIAVS